VSDYKKSTSKLLPKDNHYSAVHLTPNCIAITSSQNRYVRNIPFDPQSSCSIRRPHKNLRTNGISCKRFS